MNYAPNAEKSREYGRFQHNRGRRFGHQPRVRQRHLGENERHHPRRRANARGGPNRRRDRARPHVLLAHGGLQPVRHRIQRAHQPSSRKAARPRGNHGRHPPRGENPRLLWGRLRPRPVRRRRACGNEHRRGHRDPLGTRLPHRHARLPAGLRLPGRTRRASAHTAPGYPAYAHRTGRRGNRRRANGHLPARLARRLAHHRSHPRAPLRPRPRAAHSVRRRRLPALRPHHPAGVQPDRNPGGSGNLRMRDRQGKSNHPRPGWHRRRSEGCEASERNATAGPAVPQVGLNNDQAADSATWSEGCAASERSSVDDAIAVPQTESNNDQATGSAAWSEGCEASERNASEHAAALRVNAVSQAKQEEEDEDALWV